MTLEEIRNSDKPMLTCGDIAKVVGYKAYTIHQAVVNGKKLPFPTMVIGNEVRIPRKPFIDFMGG